TGPVVTLGSIRGGSVAAGTMVTTQTVTVASVSCPSCDDATTPADFTVKDASGASVRVHVPNTFEETWNVKKQNFVPDVGMRVVVSPYGQVRFDPDHGWWEIHPVRCWSAGECVPATAGYVRNGPPPGTPADPGYYEQGGPVPLTVPLTTRGTSATTTTTTAPSATTSTPAPTAIAP